MRTVEEILLEKISKEETIAYSELAVQINKKLKRKAVPEKGKGLGTVLSKYLHNLCQKYFQKEGVMIGAIVVKKDSGIPSSGFFKFAEKLYNLKLSTNKQKNEFWELEIKKIFKEKR